MKDKIENELEKEIIIMDFKLQYWPVTVSAPKYPP